MDGARFFLAHVARSASNRDGVGLGPWLARMVVVTENDFVIVAPQPQLLTCRLPLSAVDRVSRASPALQPGHSGSSNHHATANPWAQTQSNQADGPIGASPVVRRALAVRFRLPHHAFVAPNSLDRDDPATPENATSNNSGNVSGQLPRAIAKRERRSLELVIVPRYEADIDAILLCLFSSPKARRLRGSRLEPDTQEILVKLNEQVFSQPNIFLQGLDRVASYDADVANESSRHMSASTRLMSRFYWSKRPTSRGHPAQELAVGLSKEHIFLAQRPSQSANADAGTGSLFLLFKERFSDLDRLSVSDTSTLTLQFRSGRTLVCHFGPSGDLAGTGLLLLGRATYQRHLEHSQGSMSGPVGYFDDDECGGHSSRLASFADTHTTSFYLPPPSSNSPVTPFVHDLGGHDSHGGSVGQDAHDALDGHDIHDSQLGRPVRDLSARMPRPPAASVTSTASSVDAVLERARALLAESGHLSELVHSPNYAFDYMTDVTTNHSTYMDQSEMPFEPAPSPTTPMFVASPTPARPPTVSGSGFERPSSGPSDGEQGRTPVATSSSNFTAQPSPLPSEQQDGASEDEGPFLESPVYGDQDHFHGGTENAVLTPTSEGSASLSNSMDFATSLDSPLHTVASAAWDSMAVVNLRSSDAEDVESESLPPPPPRPQMSPAPTPPGIAPSPLSAGASSRKIRSPEPDLRPGQTWDPPDPSPPRPFSSQQIELNEEAEATEATPATPAKQTERNTRGGSEAQGPVNQGQFEQNEECRAPQGGQDNPAPAPMPKAENQAVAEPLAHSRRRDPYESEDSIEEPVRRRRQSTGLDPLPRRPPKPTRSNKSARPVLERKAESGRRKSRKRASCKQQ